MSSLGLSLMAANSAMDAVDAAKVKDQQRQRFEWERQRNEADLSTLGDKTDAAKSGYQLQSKQNTANLGLVDKQTENATAKLDMESSELNAAKLRQPDELAAKADKAKVGALLANFDVENTPRELAAKKAQGVLTDADIYVASIAKLADLMSTNDQASVMRYMNGMNDSGVFGARHEPVASVSVVNDKTNGPVFVARDANGKPVMQMTADSIRRVRASLGKTEFKSVNAGDSLVQIKGGTVTPVYTAPESTKSRGAHTGPLERDVDYLVNQHGMSKEQALAHLNSAKTMSRDQFVLKSVQDSIAMGKQPSKEQVADFGALYDSATSSTKPGLPAPSGSNSPAPANLDPRIKSLLGIP